MKSQYYAELETAEMGRLPEYPATTESLGTQELTEKQLNMEDWGWQGWGPTGRLEPVCEEWAATYVAPKPQGTISCVAAEAVAALLLRASPSLGSPLTLKPCRRTS